MSVLRCPVSSWSLRSLDHGRRNARVNRRAMTRANAQPQKNSSGSESVSTRRSGVSSEFLSVSGALAMVVSVVLLAPVAGGVLNGLVIRNSVGRAACVAIMSFSYALALSRFDLSKLRKLKLTIAFVLATRFVCVPALSHMVAIAGYAVRKAYIASQTTAAAAAVAAAAAKAPATAKATAASLSLPAGVLSSLFLLSTTPVGFSPSAALLSPFIYPTLLANLTLLTLLLFPILPLISHSVNTSFTFLNFAATLPQVAQPPSTLFLLATTTVPALLALGLLRVLPSRWTAVAGLSALPVAWACSMVLMMSAVGGLVGGSLTGLAGSVALCAGVVGMMALLGRALGAALLLDERAKRTLILYLCTQGAVIGAGIAPRTFTTAPPVASAAVGLVLTAFLAKRWKKVIVRTSRDVL